jgi:hypothetical protein
MRSGTLAMVLGGFGLALYAGCADPSSDPASDPASAPTPTAGTAEPADSAATISEASVVARVEVEPGHVVSFYEPTPGGLFTVETRAPGQSFALAPDEVSDAMKAFAHLRPQAAIPPALQAAYDRARSVTGEPADLPAHAVGGGQPATVRPRAATPGVVTQALTESSNPAVFVDNDGGCDWGPQGSFCRVSWANGFFAFFTPTTSALCTVDHYAGNGIVIQVTAGSTITSFFQGVGTIAQYSLGAAGPSELRRIDITNASGDSFHVGCRWGV